MLSIEEIKLLIEKLEKVKKEDLHIVERNDPCSCGSGKKFKKCCLLTIGNKYPHYEFILKNPSNIEILTNTLKKRR